MSNKLTILDIARLSGVGKSTVSRVLNADPKVKAATRDKVIAIIKAHGFVPSRSAKSMRSNCSMVIGIILTRLDSPSENRVIRGILKSLTEKGYDTILMESRMEINTVQRDLKTLTQRGVDGVLMFGFTGLTASMLTPWQHNLVLIAWSMDDFSSVCYDDSKAITLCAQHLYQQGLRSIAFVGVDDSDETTGFRRTRAYLDFCQSHQITPRYATGELSYQSAYLNAQKVIDARTQAVICASDTLALGSARYLQQQKRDDCVITGIGHSELLSFLFPNTLSVDLGYEQAGQYAVDMLIDQLCATEFTARQHRWPCHLIL